jgi:hypothetical protein
MLQNPTSAQNGKASSLPEKSSNTPKAEETSKVISVVAEEVKQRPTVPQVFERIQQGYALQEYYEKSSFRFKEVSEFNREAKEGAGFIMTATLPSGRKIEFTHSPSNLEFVENQERKGKEHLKNLEEEIQDFSIN